MKISGCKKWNIGLIRANSGKTRTGKTYAYQMYVSFKTSVTYKSFLISHWTTVSVVKQLSSEITQFFCRTLSDVRC